MRIVLQRVSKASVEIDGRVTASIGKGLLLLVGIEDADNESDVEWLSKKIAQMRIFADEAGKMNLSVKDTGGEILSVSQFTLHASTEKGNRPSFIQAARPEKAIPLYDAFNAALGSELGKPVRTGNFGAEMKVELINDGPVTILLDSKNKAG